jgi:hypothetical protein
MKLDVEDRIAISELIARYTRAYDFRTTVEEFMRLVTPDIVLDG